MKVVIVYFDRFFVEQGMSPGGRRVRDIGRGLNESGHEIHLCLLKRNSTQENIRFDNLNIHFFGNHKKSKLFNRKTYWSELIKLAEKEKVDWVILYNVHVDAIIPIFKLKKIGVRVATEACDLLSSFFPRNSISGLSKSLLHKSSEMLIPRFTNLNIGISKFLISQFKKIAPDTKTLLLPVLVDSDLFISSDEKSIEISKKWKIKSDRVLISYVGSLWKHHGVRNLIEAFSNIHLEYPKASLLIAGKHVDSSTHENIERLLEKFNLTDNVIFTNWVSTDEVIGIYSRSDILVMPQIEDDSMIAALPTKLAEYSQMETAIISTDVGDISLYFKNEESALLVESGKSEKIAEALIKLLEYPDLRVRLALAAKKVAIRNFDYKSACMHLSNEMLRIKTSKS